MSEIANVTYYFDGIKIMSIISHSSRNNFSVKIRNKHLRNKTTTGQIKIVMKNGEVVTTNLKIKR